MEMIPNPSRVEKLRYYCAETLQNYMYRTNAMELFVRYSVPWLPSELPINWTL